MRSPDAIARLESTLRALRLAVSARAAEERACRDAAKSERARNDRTHDVTLASVRQRRSDERRAEDDRYATRREAIETGFESDMRRLDEEASAARNDLVAKAEENTRIARERMDEAIWVAETVYEGSETRPRIEYEETREQVGIQLEELDGVEKQAREAIRRYRQPLPHAPAPPPDRVAAATSRPDAGLTLALGQAQEEARRLRTLRLAALFRGPTLLVPLVALAGAGAGIAALARGPSREAVVTGAVIGVVVMALLAVVLYGIARRQVRAAWTPLAATLAVGRACAAKTVELAAAARGVRERELVETRDREVKDAQEKYLPLIDEFARKRDDRLARVAEKVPLRQAELTARRDHDRDENESLHARRVEEIDRIAEEATTAEEERYARERAAADAREAARWGKLESAWHAAYREGSETLAEIVATDASLFPGWEDAAWAAWEPSAEPPESVRFGSVRFDLAACEGGLPDDPRLTVKGPTAWELPAGLAFPHRMSLLIETDGDGRRAAIDLVQSLLLRLLARIPPSKARLVLIDPVGLGESFAGFMHLADEMEALVGDRIWTEPRHIEQKLTDLTEHMETVIQKYLRNEFDSIEAYNERAGEIAEPYRFLVITDFPTNITDIAAKRLQSILASGPRCGVHTIIVRTRSAPRAELPAGIDESDLSRGAVVVRRAGERFTLEGEESSQLAFEPDPAPPAEILMRLTRAVGKAAKEAGRVEVPFSTIAPRDGAGDGWWSESSAKRLRVPLGRAGASKLQYLTLGEGTSQHALIAGKTGSGKSTLLHALVTSIACWYPPEEVEFYLIDFKKGVEFKTYATHRLPHARAVAIESDREFGLSVLQGLDGELKRRGDLFRSLGVQDLPGYRRLGRDDPMPRTLLIIDEFQELFVEDDKVSQDAALLLDRLVRQGRAFGIHVILGSQTLGGAYSIARATMGQMGVRIALQCSEQDSQLILSDDNAAARLLSRPGEAIYNDASGLVEGNSPFQVVWLPEEVRERYLDRAARMAEAKPSRRAGTIVFEGNVPADPAGNRALRERLDSRRWSDERAPTEIWLGDAIAIKEPTAATFRRQSGANLAIVGQQDAAALALVAMSVVSIAAQRAPADVSFVILDGTPADDPQHGMLAKVAAALPHEATVVPWRQTEEAIRAVAEDVARRQGGGDERRSVFLVIHGLQRFRQLRRNEDDFSFGGSGDGPVSADRLLGQILKEGAPLGVHVILWSDTVTNLQRAIDRTALREFDWRAMFQLSQTDSSTLIDNPAASRLGSQRALLYSEELGTIEKFRPWSMPSDEFLARVGEALAAKSEATIRRD